MASKVLITGGTGLVGQRLTDILQDQGYDVAHLSRRKRKSSDIETFTWDVSQGELEEGALEHVDHIVHLAGAGIADKRWTERRKKEIYDSRIDSTNLLYKALQNRTHHVKSFISASGVDYYADSGDQLLTEDMPPGNDFLGKTCVDWENAAKQVEDLGIRVVMLRTGIVLSARGGALKEIERPVKLGIPSHLGNGQQYYPWIHIDDLCRMYVHAIENEEMQGAYNAVGPYSVRNKELVLTIADILNRPRLSVPAPKIALHFVLGEMAALVLNSHNVSSEKIQQTGFSFRYNELKEALTNIYGKDD